MVFRVCAAAIALSLVLYIISIIGHVPKLIGDVKHEVKAIVCFSSLSPLPLTPPSHPPSHPSSHPSLSPLPLTPPSHPSLSPLPLTPPSHYSLAPLSSLSRPSLSPFPLSPLSLSLPFPSHPSNLHLFRNWKRSHRRTLQRKRKRTIT